MAEITYGTALMRYSYAGPAWEKVADIKTYPQINGQRENHDATTLSDDEEWGVPGIRTGQTSLEFTANYDWEKFQEIDALDDGTEYAFALLFGGAKVGGEFEPDGSHGAFYFKGYISVAFNEGEVDAVREMTITIIRSSAVSMEEDSVVSVITPTSTTSSSSKKSGSTTTE